MRSIAFLILTAMLAIGMLSAQEEAENETGTEAVTETEAVTGSEAGSEAETEAPTQADTDLNNPGVGSFIPSEAVKADTALPFPTDI